ncbi:MAG: hypothetical protein HOL51_27660 [Gemmatimonadetes bacterium]|nr:hypothetical protein [Gemmatimonadota bacterium]MBT5724113.1 hypothetical protein [Gammaproteobacteria bacterium]MBT5448304.1 hypothetical protein [Gemmatimonadota bacterium]MBT6620848.1 hypothetical protein [Gemmatimonadota bacterium]MBT6906362.1 hypothetical protein [Gemmatimonadota bacterium]
MSNHQLCVGAAMVDITPPMEAHLCGDGTGQHRPAHTVLESLYAKALVFDAGGQRVCMLALDLTVVGKPYTDQIRQTVAEALNTTPAAVIVCATQTHSAPSLGTFMLDPNFPLEMGPDTQYIRGSEDAYIDFVIPQAIAAAIQAGKNLAPTQMGCGRGLLGDFSFNRRGITRKGTIVMPKPFGVPKQPLGPKDLCYLEGPIDPEVGVLAFRGDSTMLGLLLHHTCHPVINFGKPEHYHAVSADWPGSWSAAMQTKLGTNCVPLVVNGCCGNINPWHPFDANFTPDHHRMGTALATMTNQIMASMTYTSEACIKFTSCSIPLSFRTIPPARSAAVETILSAHPYPPFRNDGSGVDPTWFRAASTRSVELQQQRQPYFDYEIQVFRIGDAALVALPGEPFVEGQLAIKLDSPAAFVQIAHMASHYVGYLPTREACNRDGHESNIDVTYWAKFAPGSLEQVVQKTREMISALFS